MLNEFKKFASFRLLTILLTVAVSIYLFEIAFSYIREFSDIILIFLFAWMLSFILEPLVDILVSFTKIPKLIVTSLVFLFFSLIIVGSIILLIPIMVSQFKSLSLVLPDFLDTAPAILKNSTNTMLKSLDKITDLTHLIPPIAQFILNFVTVLILAFYLIVEKEKINKEILNITPKSWHQNVKFVQRVIDQTFASFLRVQLIWGILGGVITFIVLTIFGIDYAISASFMAGILTAIPIIGPLIGVVPPATVTLIDSPTSALLIIAILLIIQQITFNFLGAKIMGNAFKISPIIVLFSLLIGLKIAGGVGGIFAVPIVSITIVIGREFYNYYLKHEKNLEI
ncbi:MAG: AI-2E family transporter [Candidatus Levybacteria bacterium]|nr:AI-2E family transporter [Candidatus Levybacteria bacterium]